MASGIAITPERLRGISARMNKGAADVEAILAGLAGNMARVRSGWVGSAQVQFNTLWDQLQRDASGLRSALTEIAKLTENAAMASEGTEPSMARTVDGFRADLDKLSDLLTPVRHNQPAPTPCSETAENHTKPDANLIDEDPAEDDLVEEGGRAVDESQETIQVPWARFMTPAAWREIETGRN